MISSQPIAVALYTDRVRICGTLLIVVGTVLVLSSTWSLGILGTFLGEAVNGRFLLCTAPPPRKFQCIFIHRF